MSKHENPIETQSAKLRSLARSKPSKNGMRAVQDGLESKWEGVEAAALNVLLAWGGKDAVSLARKNLEKHLGDKSGCTIRRAAIAVLAKHITVRDVAWVNELERQVSGDGLMLHELRKLSKRAQELKKS